MADNLTKMLMDGPDVSLRGSPTVSPVTAALWASLCFLKMYCPSSFSSPTFYLFETLVPASMYFLALSQAPPVLEKEKAIWIPETMIPAKSPETALDPNKNPTTSGDPITKRPGAIIFLIEAEVEIEIHFS